MLNVSKAGLSPLRTVPPDDPRLGAAALLAGSDGKVIGKATVLSSNLAVTVASVAFLARQKIEGGRSSGQRISLFLTFPQFSGSAEVSLAPVEVQAVDQELGFGVLSFSGTLPMPLPPGWLGDGEAPAEESICELFYYEERQTSVLSLSGRIFVGAPTYGFELDGRATTPGLGTPVFSDQRLVGIVASPPVLSLNTPSYVEVLTVGAMAQSEVTPAVRDLLGRSEPSTSVLRPFPASARDKKFAPASGPVRVSEVKREVGGAASMDADVFLRLIGSGRWVMERAEGVRRATGQSAMQIEHLVASLFESWKGFFAKAQIDERELQGIFTRTTGSEIPRADAVSAVPLGGLPVISEQVRQAVRAAAERADQRGARQIRSTHLLYGALSVKNCGLIEALLEHGLNKENISAEDEPGGDGGADEAVPAAIPGKPERVEETPTSAVLSDDALFARLSVSSRNSLGRADAMRRAAGQGAVHMEYLIAGLFDKADGPTQELFTLAGIDRPKLLQIVRETVETVVPQYFYTSDITGLPPVSKHVRDALAAAAVKAGSAGQIHRRDLLYGALSVDDCTMVQALTKRGVRKENIALLSGRNEDLGHYDPSSALAEPTPVQEHSAAWAARREVPPVPTPQPATEPAGASPTPKVDSDLWSGEDRLGYEAYARTIASLITHGETKAPLTIGIKAPWGAGKTSLMKRVQHLLDGDAKLSEENRSGTMQQGQPSQMPLRELLKELKDSTTPSRLIAKPSKEGQAYELDARITVWFNAWKYQTSEQVWAGMAHCIISQITARMGVKERELFWVRLHGRRVNADEVRRKAYETIARQLLPLALVVLVLCAVAIWAAAAFTVVGPTRYAIQGVSVLLGLLGLIWKGWGKLGDKASGTMRDLIREPDYEGKMGYLHLVESDIREVLQLATAASATKEKPEGNPLVVFVDDLDRCVPSKVAEVVEAINLFLCGDYPNCIFVLGMEPGMVAAALEVANKDVIEKVAEMGLTDRAVPLGWRFMEKIVQLPIMIPPPTEEGREKYVNSLTGLSGDLPGSAATVVVRGVAEVVPGAAAEARAPIPRPAQHGAEEEAKVRSYVEKIGPAKNAGEAAKKSEDVVAQASPEERWAAQEAGNRVYERALTDRDPVMAKFVQDVARLVNGNPRQIKRYVNVFRFYSTMRQNLRLGGVIRKQDLPSDEVLAKFVALSIQWPHAVDCLRVKEVKCADGKRISALELLERESRKMAGDGAAADAAWKKVVGKEEGMGLGAWAEERAFRELLAREGSLCAKEGHGLW